MPFFLDDDNDARITRLKNQYFGDIGDYKKYSLLRRLALDAGLRVLVGWMLTDNDARTDGKFIGYLNAPTVWRRYDETVFDFLMQHVLIDNARRVDAVARYGLIPNATFHEAVLADERAAREQYFAAITCRAVYADLVFFDPDNGLEVKSVKYGWRNSAKYLYWHEATAAYQTGCSVLIYQHYPRARRDEFTRRKALDLGTRTGAARVYSIRTAHAAYFLATQPQHGDGIDNALLAVAAQWGEHFKVTRHSSPA